MPALPDRSQCDVTTGGSLPVAGGGTLRAATPQTRELEASMTVQIEQQPPSDEVVWWRRQRDAEASAEAERLLRGPMTVLSLIFTVAVVIQLSQDPTPEARGGLLVLNGLIWLAFAAAYLWQLRLAPDRGHFVRTHILDLLIVVLPVLRPLRGLQVLRAFAGAVRSWHQIFRVLHHRGLGKIISSVLALMLVGGLIAFALEPQTFTTMSHAVWWVLVTSTTVGYGDFAPVGVPARLVAVAVMVIGIGLVGVVTANIVDFMMHEAAPGHAGAAPSGGGRPVGPPARCVGCEETATQLAHIQSQLDELLTHSRLDTPTTSPAGGHDEPHEGGR